MTVERVSVADSLSAEQKNKIVARLRTEITNLIRQSFSPADAGRNPNVMVKIRMLGIVSNTDYETLLGYFGIPLPGDQKGSTNSHAMLDAISGREFPQTPRRTLKGRRRYTAEEVDAEVKSIEVLVRQGKTNKEIARAMGWPFETENEKKLVGLRLRNLGFTQQQRRILQQKP